MKKIFDVSVIAIVCAFAANAGAKEGKSGFYLTGKAGASVVSLSDQRFLSGDEEETSKYKGGDDHDSVAVLRPVMIFIRSSVFRFVRNWSFTLVEKLIRSITLIKKAGQVVTGVMT